MNGDSFIVSNVHYLIHLADEVLRFSLPLDVLGCSPFENKIQVLNNVVRPTHRPLAQLVKRVLEKTNPRPSLPHFHVQFGQKCHSVLPNFNCESKFKYCLLHEVGRITLTSPNNCLILKNGDVVQVLNIIRDCENDAVFLYSR
jgi:hypothetical protein